jgi:hypothetical protein
MLKHPTRIVTFRISEEQYERLKNLCLDHGAPSLSDLARAAMSRLLNEYTANGKDCTLESQLLDLQTRVRFLDTQFARLSSIIEK